MVFRFSVLVALLLASALGASAQDPMRLNRDACNAGELRSCTLLGLIYETGAGGVRDVGRALGLYERACAREIPEACLRLERVREGGPGPPPEDDFVRVGRVADAETGGPIGEAIVELPELGVRVLTDSWGRADLGRLPSGSHRIVATRLGYAEVVGRLPAPWKGEFLLLLPPNLTAAAPTTGQVFGQVTEDGTGSPLANVEVTLLGPEPTRTITNGEGRFSFAGIPPGSARLRFSLLGYAERVTDLSVEAGRTVEVYATLSLQAIELDAIEVRIGSPYLERSGFYLRSRAGAGTVFTRRDFDTIDPIAVSDVFWRAPGVSVVEGRWGADVVSRREAGRDHPGPCRLRPYLDGMPMIDWDIDQVRPDDLEGIEIYQGLAAPIEYRNLSNPDGSIPCGVVLIWTRRGG